MSAFGNRKSVWLEITVNLESKKQDIKGRGDLRSGNFPFTLTHSARLLQKVARPRLLWGAQQTFSCAVFNDFTDIQKKQKVRKPV